MGKRKCLLTDELLKEYPAFKRGKSNHDAVCIICNNNISVANKGRLDLKEHLNTEKHKSNVRSGASTSKVLETFVFSNKDKDSKFIRAAEGAMAYHNVMHHQSYRSLDCLIPLMKREFPDSNICQKMACGRTKAEAIVNNIFGPHTIDLVMNDLNDISYISISTDASNHGALKIFPILIQYFDYKNGGTKCKLLDITSQPNEQSDTIANMIIDILKKYNTTTKCVAFSGDNCNTNFGGVARAGNKNVYFKLKNTINDNLIGIGCPAHILNNSVHYGFDGLPLNIDTIVTVIHNHFSIYTVRIESLKEFCNFVETEYKSTLYHSKTRWLSLFPAIHRILEIYEGLKSYFLSLEEPPAILKKHFEEDINEAYLWIAHSFMSLFQESIKRIERSDISVIEVRKILKNICLSLKERKSNNFISLKVRSILNIATRNGQENKATHIKLQINNLYDRTINYTESWLKPLDELESLEWVDLTEIPAWDKVQLSLEYLCEKGLTIDDSKLFDQVHNLKLFMEKNQENDEWKSSAANKKWIIFFKQCKTSELTSELLKITQFVFCIFGHNANVERVFSLINTQWTKERNKLELDAIKGILFTTYNMQMTCQEFHEHIINNPKILEKIGSSIKY